MPVDAIANFQYYTYECLPCAVTEAFQKASLFNLMLVVRVRATHVSYLLLDKLHLASDSMPSQGYVKGNVAILPQDTLQLHSVIPPDAEEQKYVMCALFISSHTIVSVNTLRNFPPVLVNC